MSDSKIIIAAQVEQEFEAASAVAALNDVGIAATYKPTSTDSLLGLPGAMGCPDSFDIFIPENKMAEAKDILVTIGCINADDTDTDEAESKTADDEQQEKSAEPQTLNDLMPDNPVLAAVYKVLLAFFALVIIAGFVWLSDIVIAWFMGLFR